MSKFLKFIVHFIVICTIVCVVGLAVHGIGYLCNSGKDQRGSGW